MGQSHAIEGVPKTPNRGCPVARIVIEVSDQKNNPLVLGVPEFETLISSELEFEGKSSPRPVLT